MTELEMITTLSARGYKVEKLPEPEKPFHEMTDDQLSSAESASFVELKRAHQIASTMMWRINDTQAEKFMREVRKPKRKDKKHENYVDENGTLWTPPTAWAYAQVCKARDKWHETAIDMRTAGLEAILQFCNQMNSPVDKGRAGQVVEDALLDFSARAEGNVENSEQPKEENNNAAKNRD